MRNIIIIAISLITFSSCTSYEVSCIAAKMFDYTSTDSVHVAELSRVIEVEYPFLTKDLNDEKIVKEYPAGTKVTILAHRIKDFALGLRKSPAMRSYSVGSEYLILLKDGKKAWATIYEAAEGLWAIDIETRDTVTINKVKKVSKPLRDSEFLLTYSADNGKTYKIEELWFKAGKHQPYYYHVPTSLTYPDTFWSKIFNHSPSRILVGESGYYLFPRFTWANTHWLDGWAHITLLLVALIVFFAIEVLLLMLFFEGGVDYLFFKLFYIKSLSNGAVQTLCWVLFIPIFCLFVYLTSLLDLFVVIVAYMYIDGIGDTLEMHRCPYCHSVNMLDGKGQSNKRESKSVSEPHYRDIEVKRTTIETDKEIITTRYMKRKWYNNITRNKNWNENYFCRACGRNISYRKHSSTSSEVSMN